jgi:hypothetical protein
MLFTAVEALWPAATAPAAPKTTAATITIILPLLGEWQSHLCKEQIHCRRRLSFALLRNRRNNHFRSFVVIVVTSTKALLLLQARFLFLLCFTITTASAARRRRRIHTEEAIILAKTAVA